MLNQEELKHFEAMLRAEEKKLEGAVKELSETVDFGSDVDHFEEEADEAEELSNRIGQRATFEERLERVKEALAKIEKGSYGVCAKCGEEIEREVLEASPESSLCRQCKQST